MISTRKIATSLLTHVRFHKNFCDKLDFMLNLDKIANLYAKGELPTAKEIDQFEKKKKRMVNDANALIKDKSLSLEIENMSNYTFAVKKETRKKIINDLFSKRIDKELAKEIDKLYEDSIKLESIEGIDDDFDIERTNTLDDFEEEHLFSKPTNTAYLATPDISDEHPVKVKKPTKAPQLSNNKTFNIIRKVAL